MMARSISALLIVIAACDPVPKPVTAPGGPGAPGTLVGTVHFTGTPCKDPGPPPCDGPYANYEVVVYTVDGTSVVGKAKTGADGMFTLDLPGGTYVILTPAGVTEKRRTEVVIARDALAKVQLEVDTGIR